MGEYPGPGRLKRVEKPYVAQVRPTLPRFRKLRRMPLPGRERAALRNFKSRARTRRKLKLCFEPIADVRAAGLPPMCIAQRCNPIMARHACRGGNDGGR